MLRKHVWAALGWVVLAKLVGCSSSGDPAAMAKCREMVATFCDLAGECHFQEGLVTRSEGLQLAADCKTKGAESEHCDTATKISAGYDACVTAIDNSSCSLLVESYRDRVIRLPRECSGVVTFTQ